MTDSAQTHTNTETVLVDRQGAIVTITINRPRIKNALDVPTVKAIGQAIARCDEESGVRVVIITGAGGAFSSGADIGAAGPTRCES